MTKPLQEMSLDELWQLFPIALVPHNPRWAVQFEQESARLRANLPNDSVAAISHIGSTAIPSIYAKPIIDILLEVYPGVDKVLMSDTLTKNGYILMSKETMSFNKGYTPHGFADDVFHLHLRSVGDNDEIRFRDYLNTHPAIAKQYEALKLELYKKHKHNRDKYTDGKSDFMQSILRKARHL